MTVANWITIFVPIIGLVGAGIIYHVQKSVDRANQIRAERRDLYRRLVSAFNSFNSSLLRGKSSEAMTHYIEYKGLEAETIICAPDHVVEALNTLSPLMSAYAKAKFVDNAESDISKEVRNAYENAIEAMRLDILGDTKITRQLIAGFTTGLISSISRFP
ncbi:hypothetical protein [uncultured Roseovarius sp.]|uniref:hypothetical protein n=1 Tax=uncultured Roseovarius sp. TaxID=293344 RepID=UPI00262DA530|nr:hypothetical protein [uncultured Roseovarius sp.]